MPLALKTENILNEALLRDRIKDLKEGDRARVHQAVETLMRFQTYDHTTLRRLDLSSGQAALFPAVRGSMTNTLNEILKDPAAETFRKSAALKIITVSVLNGIQEVSSIMLRNVLELLRESTIQGDAEWILSKIFANSNQSTIGKINGQIMDMLRERSNANDGAFRARINNAITMSEGARKEQFSFLRGELSPAKN